MTYPGGKGAVFQRIVNLIPPHRVYIESHAGGAAVALNKRPARLNYLIDLDPEPLANIAIPDATRWRLVNADAVTWLSQYDWQGDEFIYCDPPYLMSTRRQHRPIYRYELMSEADHSRLLDCLKALPCKVMISGYHSALYERALAGWHTETFEAMTRGGQMATEWLWMNYPAPVALHDYSYLGDNFRERERIKRKKQRWAAKWASLPILERQAILSAIAEIDDAAPSSIVTIGSRIDKNGEGCRQSSPQIVMLPSGHRVKVIGFSCNGNRVEVQHDGDGSTNWIARGKISDDLLHP